MTYLSSIHWRPVRPNLTLKDNDVHVWRVRLDIASEEVDELFGLLSPDERVRATRYRFTRDRRHFAACRGRLRIALSKYAGIPPSEIRFTYNPYGKPGIALPVQGPSIDFNISHSGGLALFAFTRQRRVGVDVEQVRPELADENVAKRFFSAREVADLRSVQGEQRVIAFFNCWTRKEAYVKGRGQGLSFALESFDVSLLPGEPAVLRRVAPDPEDADRWTLVGFSPAEGYVGAVAVEAREPRFRFLDYGGV